MINLLGNNMGYHIGTPISNTLNEKMVKFLYEEFRSRIIDRSKISKTSKTNISFLINIDSSINCDYKVSSTTDTVTVTAKDEDTMYFLCYEIISHTSSANYEINNSRDLNPATISLEDGEYNFSFKNRNIFGVNEIYKKKFGLTPKFILLLPELLSNYTVNGVAVSTKGNSNNVYESCPKGYDANKINDTNEVFQYLEDYILKNKLTEFTIGPIGDRTLSRLKTRFPNITFNTNKDCVYYTNDVINTTDVENIKTKYNKVYVVDDNSSYYDIIMNYIDFNDYKTRLTRCKELGVEGIYINTSPKTGFMSDLQNYILSALMLNVELEVDTLIDNYLTKKLSMFSIIARNIINGINTMTLNNLNDWTLNIDQHISVGDAIQKKILREIWSFSKIAKILLAIKNKTSENGIYVENGTVLTLANNFVQ